jgi:hypothetical protein
MLLHKPLTLTRPLHSCHGRLVERLTWRLIGARSPVNAFIAGQMDDFPLEIPLVAVASRMRRFASNPREYLPLDGIRRVQAKCVIITRLHNRGVHRETDAMVCCPPQS